MPKKVSLKSYIDQRLCDSASATDQRFKDQDTGTKTALASAEKAVDKAEASSEKWRANANEWRSAMSDREKNFLSRKEFYTMIITAVAVVTLLITIWKFTKGGQ
jgi:hypothetical protein